MEKEDNIIHFEQKNMITETDIILQDMQYKMHNKFALMLSKSTTWYLLSAKYIM